LLWALAALLLVSACAPAMALALPVLGSALMCLCLWRWFQRRLQGFTGDCLGATQQLCEVAFYLVLVLAL
jgi:adenosylcobinamide-GDP ribazoletransferase